VRGFIFIFFIILITGCNTTRPPQKPKKNWAEIYKNELKIAQENDDINSWIFFWPEYKKELKASNLK